MGVHTSEDKLGRSARPVLGQIVILEQIRIPNSIRFAIWNE